MAGNSPDYGDGLRQAPVETMRPEDAAIELERLASEIAAH